MRNPDRIKRIIDKFYDAWLKSPDLRFGQLLVNLIGDDNVFNVEDDKLEEELDKWLNWIDKNPSYNDIMNLITDWIKKTQEEETIKNREEILKLVNKKDEQTNN